jgi:hypothetical protein
MPRAIFISNPTSLFMDRSASQPAIPPMKVPGVLAAPVDTDFLPRGNPKDRAYSGWQSAGRGKRRRHYGGQ